MDTSINRCIAINKNNKRCRAKITNKNELFCCTSHYPINKELITNGCFMCNEQIHKSNDILYFECKHAFHKQCYLEWLEYSTYKTPICLICRNDVIKKDSTKLNNQYIKLINDIKPLTDINIIISHAKNKLYISKFHKKNNTI